MGLFSMLFGRKGPEIEDCSSKSKRKWRVRIESTDPSRSCSAAIFEEGNDKIRFVSAGSRSELDRRIKYFMATH